MNKIKIHYTISQKLCGEIKRVCVVGNSELQCGCAMQQYFPAPYFSFVESWREDVSGDTKSELLNDYVDAHTDNNFQEQSHS